MRTIHRLKIGGILLLIGLGGVLIVLAIKWPFTKEAVTRSYERITRSNVSIGYFRRSFWPRPGFEAKSVSFSRGSGRPFATIETISAQSGWLALLTFTHRIKTMQVRGLRIDIPEKLPPPSKTGETGIKTTVEVLDANGAIMTITHGSNTLRFDFSKLVLRNLASNKAVEYDLSFASSIPAVQVTAHGSFGPLHTQNKGETSLSGQFALHDWDLAEYRIIGGTVSANGSFGGTLSDINVQGHTHISGFEVVSSHHGEDLNGDFGAKVDGLKGDVFIKRAGISFLQTKLFAEGSIAGENSEPSKIPSIKVHSREARVEDLLYMFVSGRQAAMDGAIDLEGQIVLPPGKERFLRKIRLDGDFHIANSVLTNPRSEEKIAELSERSHGEHSENPRPVSAEIASKVKLRNGVAQLSDSVFRVPGATAKVHGTYNLISEAIDLKGTLAMHASLSRAAGGFKSILLVPLDPLYKKDGAGALVHVRMMGTYAHPRFHVSLKP